jgi:hypothetical protein
MKAKGGSHSSEQVCFLTRIFLSCTASLAKGFQLK